MSPGGGASLDLADALGLSVRPTGPAPPGPPPLFPPASTPVFSGPTAVFVDPDPISKLQIPANLLSKFATDDLLDLTLGNYRAWSRRVRDILSVCSDLEEYLDESSVCPDRATRAHSTKAWTHNNHHVLSFIHLQCSDNEREHIALIASASTLWAFLYDRHLNRSPHTQVLLLRDLLQLQFDSSKALVPQAHQCVTVCRQIIAMGPLDDESLGKVALLHMMRTSLPELQCAIADSLSRASPAAPFTIADIIKRIELGVMRGGQTAQGQNRPYT